MRLFITGATGLVGRRLVVDRLERGDDLIVVSRDPRKAGELFAAKTNPRVTVVGGDPTRPGPWQGSVDGCDAVIHLAGAGIADRRWTRRYKALIVSSRVDSTRHVVEAMGTARQRPRVLVSASAAGYYGDTGDRPTTESAGPGDDFLADVCAQWEHQATAALAVEVRVVTLRTAMVLDDRGGALPRLALPFRLMVGGPIGRGRRAVPWIHWRDVIGIIDLAMRDQSLSGPINLASPETVTAREFARALGRALGRASWAPVPWLALRIALGELADSLVVSQHIVPAAALAHGYEFLYPRLDLALHALFSRSAADRPVPGGGGRSGAIHRRPRRAPPPAPRLERPFTPPIDAAPPAPVKLLAIDVDGTLLTSSERLSPTVIQACRAAERAGCRIVLATGRPPRSVRSILQSLGVDALVIAHHGALIWNPRTDAAEHHQPLDVLLARQIINLCRGIEPELLVGLETIDRWTTDRFDPAFRTDTSRLMPPHTIAELDTLLTAPITKLNLLREPVRLQRVLAAVRERFWHPGQIHLHFTNPHLIQITDRRADKGAALELLADRLGLARDNVMAIGDALNDAGMVRWAGFGVAVANADPAVRAAADMVVESNDEHGVALAIQRYVLHRSGRD